MNVIKTPKSSKIYKNLKVISSRGVVVREYDYTTISFSVHENILIINDLDGQLIEAYALKQGEAIIMDITK